MLAHRGDPVAASETFARPLPLPPSSGRCLRFGAFEADLEAGELRKRGVKVRVPYQAFQVLEMLLQRPRGVVSREELRARIWPDGVFVDFEHGLNKAINKLRRALGDSPTRPAFVETIPRRGYRFMESLSVGATTACPASHSASLRIAVLPLEGISANADEESLCDALTQQIISQLGQLCSHSLRVIARRSVLRYKHAPKSIHQVGQELSVDYIVEGTVRLDRGRVRITVHLVQVHSEAQLWSQSYDRDFADALLAEQEVSLKISRSLAQELFPAQFNNAADDDLESSENFAAYSLLAATP